LPRPRAKRREAPPPVGDLCLLAALADLPPGNVHPERSRHNLRQVHRRNSSHPPTSTLRPADFLPSHVALIPRCAGPNKQQQTLLPRSRFYFAFFAPLPTRLADPGPGADYRPPLHQSHRQHAAATSPALADPLGHRQRPQRGKARLTDQQRIAVAPCSPCSSSKQTARSSR
jgi:hypothetical protein